ncbi:hypothetical protein FIU82_16325 (plasmid) [Pseudoalteromonas sp. THAF3]|uniref:hypothetical protein n=1 Tax=Pseudoalteromonas sp. THAF3 TaxID=2587843 RepID=UPI001268B9D0|nr:hypothetical protein [Pseudoalteromonas sp. THAF3]QFU06556.1 hypothetical protein FIU82_16325 [Pseudoalteromonas sp. THAF3]
MIKNTALFICISISSVACANVDKKTIAPTFGSENKTDGYFLEKLALNKPEQFKELSNKKWFYSYEVTSESKKTLEINSCKKLSEALEEGYSSSNYREQKALIATNKICTTWSHMGELKPSKKSFIGALKHSLNLPNKMPPELSLVISNDDKRRLENASSWEEMGQIKNIEPVNDEQAVYYDKDGGIQRLTIMAYGDYNEDGVEDVVLHMANAVERGSYSSSYSYVITRLTADSKYSLIKKF